MTIISAISSFSSSSSTSLNKMNVNGNSYSRSSSPSSSFGNNQNAHLADVNILANILGLIGINVSAKVL